MALHKNIFSGVWAIYPHFAESYLPTIRKIIQADTYSPDEIALLKSEKINSTSFKISASENETETKPDDPVFGIVPISGVITRDGGLCNYGCNDWAQMVQTFAEAEDISAIILEIDSGGGEALGGVNLHKAIINARSKKPVLAFVKGGGGLCASAAYDIASHAHEIYASHKFDKIGSIGTYLTFADLQPMYEKMGVKFHEIYATESTEKNKSFRDALNGKYAPLQSEIDEINTDFINRVKNNRPQIKDDKKVFKGKIYTAEKAKEIGLIDGVKTFEETLQRAANLVNRKPNMENTENTEEKNLLQKIWAMLNGNVEISQTPEAPNLQEQNTESASEILERLQNLEEKMAELQAENTSLKKESEQLKAEKGKLENELFEGTKAKPNKSEKTPNFEAEEAAPVYSFDKLLRERYPEIVR